MIDVDEQSRPTGRTGAAGIGLDNNNTEASKMAAASPAAAAVI